MEDKLIRINGPLHQKVKATAALYNMSLREFTERALKKFILPDLEARTLDDEALIDAEE